jgi:hypothetical protein
MVGGTLLGAMRSGDLLSHDDDIDFAFWCDKSDPQDVTLVTFGLERELAAAGYTVVRHSHTPTWRSSSSPPTGHGLLHRHLRRLPREDGLYNQPFALRGELPRAELLPTRPLEVRGVALPAPQCRSRG